MRRRRPHWRAVIAIAAAGMAACGGGGGGDHAPKAGQLRCVDDIAQGRVVYSTALVPGNVLAIADLDGDGIPDLVTNAPGDSIAVHPGAGDGSFCGGKTFDGGGTSQAVAADIDADGAPDVVTTDGKDIFVLFNSGSGQLMSPAPTSLGLPSNGFVRHLEVADFNGDGIPDLATPNGDTGHLSILIGKGDGTFDVEFRSIEADQTLELAVGDLNNDGLSDLVVSGLFPEADLPEWYALLATGGGDLGSKQQVNFPGEFSVPYLADLNGDGILDLVATVGDNVSFVIGRGNGEFDSVQTLQVVSSDLPASLSSYLVVLDFDGDGRNDLLTVERPRDSTGLGGVAKLHVNRGDNTFSVSQVFDVPNSLTLPGDLNGDGSVDLVIPGTPLSVWLGSSSGTFAPRQTVPRYSVGNGPVSVVLADLNQDAVLDAVVANSGSSSLSLLMGRGDGTFRDAQILALEPDAAPADVAVADLNADSIPDLVTADRGSNSITLLLGRGRGSFEVEQRFEVGSEPSNVVVADLNADGSADILTANVGREMDGQGDSPGISIFLGTGMGSFESVNPVSGSFVPDIAVSDFNQDGFSDLAALVNPAGRPVGGRPRLLPSRIAEGSISSGGPSLVLFLGNGDGTFADFSKVPLTSAGSSVALSVADLNHDRYPDIVTANHGCGSSILFPEGCSGRSGLSVLLGLDDSFTVAGEIPSGGPADIVLGLVDSNDTPDIVTLYETGVLSIRLGAGDGTFEAPQSFETEAHPVSMAADDLNGDGVLDVVTANFDSNDISVLLGRRAIE